jgi:hypothetical protein
MQDTTNADAILKEYYLPVIREMVNQKAILLFGYSPAELSAGMGTANASQGETLNYMGISRDAERLEFAGREWVMPAHVTRNESGNARDEGGILPPAGQQGWQDLKDEVRRFYKKIQVSGFAIAVSERSVGAYLRLLETETEGAINDLRKDMNRQAFGDQTGTLATITADGVNTFTVNNLQYLRVGMYIDLVNKTTDAILAANRQITSIVTATRVVTYDGADVTTVAGTHVPCLNGNWKKELNGLTNMIRTDTAAYYTLHGINCSTAGNEWWKSHVEDGGSATFDEDQGQLLLDYIGAEGKETEILIGTRGIRRRYVNTLKAQKRFNDTASGTLHGGFKFIDYNGYPMLYDDDAPKGKLWFLRPSDFLWVWLGGNDFQWMDRDGAVLRKIEYPDLDAYGATLFKYCDLACGDRKNQGVIYDLDDDTP